MEGSGRRKRKMGNEEEKDDEDDEEKKVEKFFALIRSTREVRDRLRNVAVQNVSEEKEIQKKIEEEKAAAAAADADGRWNPAFQPEDFMEGSVSGSKDPLVLSDASASPSSEIKHGPEKESKDGGGEGGGGGGLDLNLSLSL